MQCHISIVKRERDYRLPFLLVQAFQFVSFIFGSRFLIEQQKLQEINIREAEKGRKGEGGEKGKRIKGRKEEKDRNASLPLSPIIPFLYNPLLSFTILPSILTASDKIHPPPFPRGK